MLGSPAVSFEGGRICEIWRHREDQGKPLAGFGAGLEGAA